ncbi:VOC family protein [Pseudomonas trivialis]|uniref:PhnB-like domain-containing protein n=1 Tax=Pseudomonas trivialis TaxID=200450 RepID=A0A0H5AFD9_9PSED|nr:VOC family protein [Pseudomonas trivialis]AKS09816.1 hypothetical protein AA957_28100 [Pseudomonas trivialis]
MNRKNTLCLWYNGTALEAATFYADTFPDSQESACGWCKDKWGLSWQISPRVLTDAVTHPDKATAKRAFDAMMTMKKIDITAIEAAVAAG